MLPSVSLSSSIFMDDYFLTSIFNEWQQHSIIWKLVPHTFLLRENDLGAFCNTSSRDSPCIMEVLLLTFKYKASSSAMNFKVLGHISGSLSFCPCQPNHGNRAMSINHIKAQDLPLSSGTELLHPGLGTNLVTRNFIAGSTASSWTTIYSGIDFMRVVDITQLIHIKVIRDNLVNPLKSNQLRSVIVWSY